MGRSSHHDTISQLVFYGWDPLCRCNILTDTCIGDLGGHGIHSAGGNSLVLDSAELAAYMIMHWHMRLMEA